MKDPVHHAVYWYTLKKPVITPLASDTSADVVIVGGGMAGLTCAQNLSARGLRVVVLEKDFCGGGASGKSSGFITPDSELELMDLVDTYGAGQARDLWQFASGGVDHIRETITQYALKCDFKEEDSLFIARRQSDFDKEITGEHDARTSLGYQSTLYSKTTVNEVIGSSKYFGAVRYAGTFSICAYLYLQQLKEALTGQGVQVFEGSEVTRVTPGGVQAGNHEVKARTVVLCMDRFSPDVGALKREVYGAQTFLAISQALPDDVARRIFPDKEMMVWDTDLIYQYFRLTHDKRLLVGASSILLTYDHRNGERSMESKIINYVRRMFGVELEIEYSWPGLIGVSQDFLPLAGRDPSYHNVYYIAGAAGLPWAAALGNYVADAVSGEGALSIDQFRKERAFPLNKTVNAVLPKPISFAVSHGMVKYF